MGLAASQARLLFITLRQNDVSANMQRVSHDTMVLARDKDIVAEKYEQMRNEKSYKLKDDVDLSYNSLMGAGAAQNGTLNLITNSAGAVVLSSSLASSFGLTEASGNGADFKSATGCSSRVAFVSKMMGITETEANNLVGSTTTTTSSSSTGASLSVNSFLNTITAGSKTIPTNNYGYKDDLSISGYTSKDFNEFMKVSNNHLRTVQSGNNTIIGQFGSSIIEKSNNDSSVEFGTQPQTLADLYKNAGTINGTLFLGSSADGDKPDFSAVKSNFEAFTSMAANLLCDAFKSTNMFNSENIEALIKQVNGNLVNQYENNINGLGTATPTKDQCNSAMKNLGSQKGYGWDDARGHHNENSLAMSMIAAKDLGCITATTSYKEGKGDKNTWSFSVDAGKYVKDLINEVFSKLTNGACQTSDYNNNKTTDTSSEYTIVSKYLATEETQSSDTSLNSVNENAANYYAKMYDNLSAYGWVIDDGVTNKSTLNEKLTNQTYFVNGTTVTNTDSALYEEDTSVDNTAKAEAYWKVEMQKISTKEKKLETELTNLQTEYSSLTSDYESVNSIIQKNISRSFTYCQNG